MAGDKASDAKMAELKNRKKELGLTNAQLAYLAELPLGTVSKIMTGETKKPGYVTVEKMDKALLKLEATRRIEAYLKAMDEYYRNHPEVENNQKEYEKIYRMQNKLENVPIPFARMIDENSDNCLNNTSLAPIPSMLININTLQDLGEDRRLELIDGRIIFGEYPSVEHQRMVKSLGRIIDDFIEKNGGDCEVFDVGINVQLDEDEYTLVGPDIAVVCDSSKITDKGILGAPDWVIEVTSPHTRRIDYSLKLGKYIASGVREYWIVDIQKNIVTVYTDGEPVMAHLYQISEEIPVGIYEGKLKIICKL